MLELASRATLSRSLADLVNVDAGLTGVPAFGLMGFAFLTLTITIGLLPVSSPVTGAVTILAVADHRAKHMRLVTAMRKGARRLFPLVGDSIITR